MSNREIIETTISEACICLFEDYALPLRHVAELGAQAEADLEYCSVIGFGGEQLRGSLVLACSREPLGRTLPSADASFREWISELANQLLGRIKNKLIPRGVTLQLSTPVVLRGQQLAPIPRGAVSRHVFRCEGSGHVCVWFDAELAAGLDLSQVVESPGVVAEGDSLLF